MKRISTFILLTLTGVSFVVMASSCKSHKKSSKSGTTKDTTVQTDSNSTRNKNKNFVPTADMPKLAPGTAAVSARVIMYDESAPMHVTLLILGVRAYGTSTPALAKKTELKALISKALLNNHSLGEIKEEFTSSDTLSLVLSFSQEVAVGGVSHNWTVISYNKN